MRPSTIRWICFFAACAASLGGLATLHVQISRVVAEASEPTYEPSRVEHREPSWPVACDDLMPLTYDFGEVRAPEPIADDNTPAIANGIDTVAAPSAEPPARPHLTAPSAASTDALDVHE